MINLKATYCLSIGLIALLFACSSPKSKEFRLRPGEWELVFDIGKSGHQELIPIRLMIDSVGRFAIRNNGELIELDSVEWTKSAFHVKMPLFQTFLDGVATSDSVLTGQLTDPTRDKDYSIPFQATFASYTEKPETRLEERQIFEATFSPKDTAERYRAIGIFDFWEDHVSGTFLTETGDYRFLHGKKQEDKLWLSCFDGSHLFYFKGTCRNDSIVDGLFYSGIHWSEPWEARKNDQASLRDPDSLTYILPGSGPFQFSASDFEGNPVKFDAASFKNKVTVVQIFGSWCPNCSDESIFLDGLHEEYQDKGLQVIPVAFERSNDLKQNVEVIKSHLKDLDVKYPVFIGGNKSDAGKVFPMLNRVMSFPTTLIVDKRGEVRKIHTGFYGPGTGDYYLHYTDRIELFISQLLLEN